MSTCRVGTGVPLWQEALMNRAAGACDIRTDDWTSRWRLPSHSSGDPTRRGRGHVGIA